MAICEDCVDLVIIIIEEERKNWDAGKSAPEPSGQPGG
jgi:hypothetical protein